jgi:hypothetical protein
MDKQKMIDKTVEVLRPFETENLMNTLQTLSLKELFTNPILLCVFAILLFFGVYKKSKTILLSLFSIVGMILIIKFALPAGTAGNAEMSLGSVVPFVVGGVVIGAVIIYFTFIKSE